MLNRVETQEDEDATFEISREQRSQAVAVAGQALVSLPVWTLEHCKKFEVTFRRRRKEMNHLVMHFLVPIPLFQGGGGIDGPDRERLTGNGSIFKLFVICFSIRTLGTAEK